MRRFRLIRDEDASGVSGTGFVAEGVHFANGKVVLAWLTQASSLGVYDSMDDLMRIHGHGGKTRVVWTDCGLDPVRPQWFYRLGESDDDEDEDTPPAREEQGFTVESRGRVIRHLTCGLDGDAWKVSAYRNGSLSASFRLMGLAEAKKFADSIIRMWEHEDGVIVPIRLSDQEEDHGNL